MNQESSVHPRDLQVLQRETAPFRSPLTLGRPSTPGKQGQARAGGRRGPIPGEAWQCKEEATCLFPEQRARESGLGQALDVGAQGPQQAPGRC